MEPSGVDRKLAVILAADVEGFTRLMRADEEATLKTLNTYRKIILDLIDRHRGRVFGTAGDSVLAEFGSAVEAVRCAISVQEELRVRNAELPDDRQLRFRIGINVGDVMVEGDDLFGDGVNVAARLEGVAEPGGICISGDVYNQVRHKLSVSFDDIGPQEMKNIAEPVSVFRIVPGSVSVAETAKPTPAPAVAPRWRIPAIAAAVLVVVAVGAAAIWDAYLRPAPAPQVTALEKAPAPSFPDKLSIAVLPFVNMSGDPEQEYFTDGMTDDLITDLSKISGLFVIARHSVFTYKGKPVKVQRVAEELGVRYVLEGSVRRAEGKIRINAQLIDATTGQHLWADRYDRDYKDIFALQDEVIQRIVSALSVSLSPGEEAQLASQYTDNLEAYEYYLRGEQALYSYDNYYPDGLDGALVMYEKAIELDPRFARAYAGHATANYYVWRLAYMRPTRSVTEPREKAIASVTRALALDANLPRAHSALALLQLADGHYDEAIAAAAKSVALDPNNADSYVTQALVLTKAGRHEEAREVMDSAYRLNPKAPPLYDLILGKIQFDNRQYAQAIESVNKAWRGQPHSYHFYQYYLLPAYAHLGRLEESKLQAAAILDPQWLPFENVMRLRRLGLYKLEEDIEHYVDGFREAGVPELPYGYEGSEDNKLSGEESRALLFGRTISAININNFQRLLIDRTMDGRISVRGPWGTDTGTSRIEGDMVCDRMQAYGGRKSCGFVFRNPTGTPEKKNEYHWVNDTGVFAFSPAG